MKILQPPTSKTYKTVYTMYCPRCRALLEFDSKDLSASRNSLWVTCPCCQNIIDVNDWDMNDWKSNQFQSEEEPEPPRFKFPDSFYHFGESNQAVKIPDDEVQQMVDRMVKRFPELKPGEFGVEATGDTMVLALKFGDSNEIVVAKNYWEDEFITEE